MLGAIRANDFLRQANEYGHAGGDDASSRTDPDSAERLTGIYGSAGWGSVLLTAPQPLHLDVSAEERTDRIDQGSEVLRRYPDRYTGV